MKGAEKNESRTERAAKKNSDAEDDFAELRAGFEIGVGGGSFGEGEDAVNDGL